MIRNTKITRTANLIKTVLLAFALAAGTAFTALAGTIQGHLDTVSSDRITGWAFDMEQGAAGVPIDIMVKDLRTGMTLLELHTTANSTHSGLTTLNNGTGSHGFSADIDWNELPDGVYSIYAFSDGQPLSNAITYTNTRSDADVTSGTDASGSNASRTSGISTSGISADGMSSDGMSADDMSDDSIAASDINADSITASCKGAMDIAASSSSLIPLGNFKITSYCPCRSCSEGWGHKTSSGALATANHTVAVDTRVIPLGSRLLIEGIVYTAEDRGGAVRGNHIDVYYDTHAETRIHGTRQAQVYLLR